ncbi:peptidoglycan DD-metalloendopeptidase family protein [Sphingomonas sabuli]|uniref:Peptidoglycan DD-metalloendopeptidase family protein n=1 Tax=Sphingomonas sabuli TaxID=2764186 RepID=A0A7G9L1F3_9SPHN|nr:peptidoglycan DD-metalloendopeptidase family protein [Sphingomonas sabuli]QNM82452.1 peptidoglycan DD-metalloendopeptidase family protein [Sphingomonas sabuli]
MVRLVAFALLAAGTASVTASAPAAPERPTVEAQIAQAEKEATAAVAEQQRLEKLAGKARNEAARLHARQLAAAQAIAAAEAGISAADAKTRLAVAQLAMQQQRLAREQAPLSALLGGLVLTSRRPPLLQLASSGSTAELVRLRILVDAVTPAIEARTAALRGDIDRAARLRQRAAEAAQEVRAGRNRLVASRKAFAELENRALALAGTRGSQALGAGDIAIARGEALDEVRRTADSSRSVAAQASALASLGPAPLPGGGAEPFRPGIAYRLPADARVMDGLGEVSTNGVRSRGTTLATRRGQRLSAPAAGTIVFAGPFRDYDGVVIIDHGAGWKSVLVNAGTALAKGERVKMGDFVGIALGPVEIQLHNGADPVSPALIAGSSAMLSKRPKGG